MFPAAKEAPFHSGQRQPYSKRDGRETKSGDGMGKRDTRDLFKTYCICLYDAALWSMYNKGSLRKLSSCYNKCVKLFLGV